VGSLQSEKAIGSPQGRVLMRREAEYSLLAAFRDHELRFLHYCILRLPKLSRNSSPSLPDQIPSYPNAPLTHILQPNSKINQRPIPRNPCNIHVLAREQAVQVTVLKAQKPQGRLLQTKLELPAVRALAATRTILKYTISD